jgi:type I restriction enzyme, R subunit
VAYTEIGVVEKPIIDWLQELGWKYVPADQLNRDAEEPFDLDVLKEAIRRLNPATILTTDDVDTVVNHLRQISNDISGNRHFSEWVKGDGSIVLRRGEKAQIIRLINTNKEENTFTVTNQFTFYGYEHVRFDIVLMVNGIPLALIEAKKPTHETLDYHAAITQILRYHKDAPQFFKHLALTCATDGVNFRYDWVTPDKFFEWKHQEKLYSDPLEASVKTLFERDFFLDLINNFIIFEKEREKVRKKIAMYQQVNAANKIVSRVLEEKTQNGLIWHTQGSGKSLTMLFAAWKLKKAPQLLNPTILLIVDRIDLMRQLSGTFANVDFPYTAKAKSSKDLFEKLSQDSREVIITTIQKFREMKEALSTRDNIIIFVDEAHRSQYGKFAMRMRQAFPKAFVFGFTGTPIEKGPTGKNTFRTFCPPGETYLDKYGIRQSIEDGATVRLLYQSRLVKYHIPQEELDRKFLSITLGLSDKEQDQVLDKSATLRTAMKAQARIEAIAKDVCDHYITSIAPNGFKAQLVAVDREACALYKQALDRRLPAEESVVIYTSNSNDNDLLRRYHLDKDEQMKIAGGGFQIKGENPKILIVTDMLLTGFDAPMEQVMYLDKPMRDHKLLQAIARTNRPYPGKAAGIIVDYVGVFDNLVKALNFQEEDIEGVAYNYDTLKQEFSAIITSVVKPFSGIVRDGSRESLFKAFSILDDETQYKEFKTGLSKLKRRYETIAPDPFLLEYDDDLTWLIEVNEAYNKFHHRVGPDLSEYQEKTKQLIGEKLIVNALDMQFPLFEIDSEYLKKLDAHHFTKRQKAMEITEAVRHHISINVETNPVYETLSHRLERILKIDDSSKMLEQMEVLVGEIVEIERRAKELGISKEEYALLNVAKKYTPNESDAALITFVKRVTSTIKVQLFPGWWRKVKVATEIEQTVFNACFEEFRAQLAIKEISAFTEELMDFIVKYNQ